MSISATFIIENTAGINASIVAQVQALVQAAINAWSAVLAGDSTTTVTITFADTTSSGRAEGGNNTSLFLGSLNGNNVSEPGAAYELRTGLEHNQVGADIHLTIARDYLLNVLFLDSTLASSDDIPGNRTDAYSVFLHEIGHALGFIGYYNEPSDSFAFNANTPYDTHILLRAGEVYYDGANVRAIYGDAIPLTNNNYSHYGNTGAFPGNSNDPLTGLMNGVAFYNGYRYSIGALDLAVMADNGLGTIQDDHFSVGLMRAFNGGSGTDTADFLSATSAVTFSLAAPGAQATGGAGSVTLVGIENLMGSAYGDTLTGDNGTNLLNGGDGNDILLGGGGGDTLVGGFGYDVLTGGVGADTFSDTAAGLNGDTITDFARGDRIVLSDATSGLTVGLIVGSSGSQITFGSTSVFLSDARNLSIAFGAAPEGGVQLLLGGPPIIISSAVVSDPSWAFSSRLAAAPEIPAAFAEHGFLEGPSQFRDLLNLRMGDDLFVVS